MEFLDTNLHSSRRKASKISIQLSIQSNSNQHEDCILDEATEDKGKRHPRMSFAF